MPPALVEGTESYVMFGLMILLGHDSWWQGTLYWVLSVGVIITILQRLNWAYYNLDWFVYTEFLIPFNNLIYNGILTITFEEEALANNSSYQGKQWQ